MDSSSAKDGKDAELSFRSQDNSVDESIQSSLDEDSPASAQNFLFIDNSSDRTRSNEAIRIHVMRESHRARRTRRGRSSSTTSSGRMLIWDRNSPSNTSTLESPTTGPGMDEEYSQAVGQRIAVTQESTKNLLAYNETSVQGTAASTNRHKLFD